MAWTLSGSRSRFLPGGGGGARHVAGVADPVDGAGRALLVVLVGAGEVSRGLSELQLQAVDGLAEADQLVAQELSRIDHPHTLFGVKIGLLISK
jgi:hypothetical protein